jgi:group I intron endonuclease
MASGVYVIANTVSGKQYVGSAADLTQRKAVHFTRLRHGKHASRHLQAAFKKHGEAAFSFSVLEELEAPDRDTLLACEQKWIDALRPAYNKRLVADSNLGLPMSEAQKEIQRQRILAWRETPEGIAHAAALVERTRDSWADPEKRAKRLEAVRAAWTPEKRAAQSEHNKLHQRHILIDGEHFGARRVWTEDEKKRSGAKMKKAWESRAPVSEEDIRKLVTDANPAWSFRELTGVRSHDKVRIHCSTHDHEQWQTIAKLRYAQRGCKLCGYARSSEVQAGRPKSKSSLSSEFQE